MNPVGRRPVDAAHTYAARGWPVFPAHAPVARRGSPVRCTCGHNDCTSIGKHPRTRDGLKSATTHPTEIDDWWRRWPGAGVAIRTGQASGLLVVDIDPDHGGQASLDALVAKHGPLPLGRTIHTGSGGTHLYYRHPGGNLANTAGRLGSGIDTRADGGYVIAPPSRHRSGGIYKVAAAGHVIPDAPDWLLRQLEPPTARPAERPTVSARDTTAWGRAALDGELARLSQAHEGCRNDTLNRVAYRLGQVVGAGALAENDVLPALIDQGIAIGLREREVVATVHSGLMAGEAQPRGPAPSSRQAEHVETYP